MELLKTNICIIAERCLSDTIEFGYKDELRLLITMFKTNGTHIEAHWKTVGDLEHEISAYTAGFVIHVDSDQVRTQQRLTQMLHKTETRYLKVVQKLDFERRKSIHNLALFS